MPLEGLRAWIGEVERKLDKRTRVFLALCVIAIGIAGAAIYLALDARSDSVSEGDVQELQRELEAQGIGGAAGGAELSRLEAEVQSLQAEVERLKGDGTGSGSGQGNGGSSRGQDGNGDDGSGGASGGTSGGEGGSGAGSPGASGGAVPEKGDPARLQELLERAKEQSEANE